MNIPLAANSTKFTNYFHVAICDHPPIDPTNQPNNQTTDHMYNVNPVHQTQSNQYLFGESSVN
jgi:hypothetical protein